MGFDLIVGGAGPAGLAAAVEARRHGLSVLVLEQRPEQPAAGARAAHATRRNVVLLDEASVRLAQEHGIADLLFDGRHGVRAVAGDASLATLGQVERSWRTAAERMGVRIDFGSAVTGIRQLRDRGGVEVRFLGSDGVEAAARGRMYVEAAGARSGAERRAQLGIRSIQLGRDAQVVVGQLAPSGRSTYDTAFHRTADGVRSQVMWLATPESLTFTGMRPAGAPPLRGPSDAAAWWSDLLRREMPAAVPHGEAWATVAKSTTARRFRVGDVVLAGDAAGTVHPVTGRGVNQALQDARAAARLARRLAGGTFPPAAAYGLYELRVGSSHLRAAASSASASMSTAARLGVVTVPLGVLYGFALLRSRD